MGLFDTKCRVCNQNANPFGGSFEAAFLRKYGICERCFINSKPLIPSGNHFVPWEYRYDTYVPEYSYMNNYVKVDPKHFFDENASLPVISWCGKHKKWKIKHGYKHPTMYFDEKKDIINALERKVPSKLVKRNGHYVEQTQRDIENENKELPKIYKCSKYKKWKIEFNFANEKSGQARDLVWYFDTKKALIEAMEK